jgi:site-specific DNA recombinase
MVAPPPDADLTAIYCRKSLKGDKLQVTVNRQRKLALADCEKLGLRVAPAHVYIDNGVSAWRRNRKRPGWDKLMAAARRGEIKHIVCYHPDRLMRQPFDLEELLSISDERGIMLYGRVNRRDLQDPDDRYALRIEIAHACRSSDDTSRRTRDKLQERAEAGLYNGTRPYGYSKNGMKLIPAEADVVREIFSRFTAGEKPYAIAADLNKRGVLTAKGSAWTETSIRRQLRSRHVAGICVHRDEEIGVGKWPAIITRPAWDFTQELLTFRSAAADAERKNRAAPRAYILRGLVVCGKCGTTMAGCSGTVYRCSRANRQDEHKCSRSMRAEPLERFVEDAAVKLLTRLSVDNRRHGGNPVVDAAVAAIASDEQQLKDLHDMWLAKEIDTAEYRADRREIQARIRANEKKTVVTTRPLEAIEDLIGPDADTKWKALDSGRKNSVLRFLFSAVIIGEGAMVRYPSSIDYGRIEIEENELA